MKDNGIDDLDVLKLAHGERDRYSKLCYDEIDRRDGIIRKGHNLAFGALLAGLVFGALVGVASRFDTSFDACAANTAKDLRERCCSCTQAELGRCGR
jgi:hypothetical protein